MRSKKEFRNLDRIEAPFREETPDCRGGLLFQIVDHAAKVSVQASLPREFVSANDEEGDGPRQWRRRSTGGRGKMIL